MHRTNRSVLSLAGSIRVKIPLLENLGFEILSSSLIGISSDSIIDKSQDVEVSESLHDDIEDKIDEELERIDNDQIGKS